MLGQFGKSCSDGIFTVCNTIPDKKRIAVGKCTDEGDHVIVGRKFASVQPQVVDRRTERGDHVSDFYPPCGLDRGKGDSRKPKTGQGLTLGKNIKDREVLFQIVFGVRTLARDAEIQ